MLDLYKSLFRVNLHIMVNNSHYICSFCGATLRFRYQVGYSDIPISIYCPKCNCHISGKIYIGQNKPSIYEAIIGATRTNDDNSEFQIELSTDFLVDKCKKSDPSKIELSMFFRSDPFDEERTKRRNNLLYLAQNVDYTINIIENLYNLLRNDRIPLIKDFFLNVKDPVLSSLKKQIDYRKIINRLDALLAIKHFTNSLLAPTMPPLVFEKLYGVMNEKIRRIVVNHGQEFSEYLRYVDDDYLKTYLYRMPKYFSDYLRCIEQLIPIYDNYQEFDSINLAEKGVSTLSIDELSTIYKKGFELLCDSIDLVAGLDNIESRGHFDDFGSGREDFDAKVNGFNSKYSKYAAFTSGDSDLFEGIRNKLNRIIRNAEGHNSIIVNGLKQEVEFQNKHRGATDSLKISFLEFGKMCIDLHVAILYVWEFLYQIVKFKAALIDGIKLNYGL